MQQHSKISAESLKGAILTASLGLGVLLGILVSAPAHSAVTDSLIEGAKLCTRQLPRYERQYGIPTHLLSAIASTESGRYHKGLNIKVPWPWTINADGKGYYFDSKGEAIAMVNKLRARGVKSIDVGCMQVNLMHHPHAFASLDDAFNPENNVAYAASFLRALYQEDNSWKKAAAHYHSRTPSRGSEYVGHVYDSWYTIVDKLRMAKVEVPTSSLAAMNDMKKQSASNFYNLSSPNRPYGASKVYIAGQGKSSGKSDYSGKSNSGVKVTRLPEQRGHKVAAYKSPRMNSIQVSSAVDPRRDQGIMVVTPDIKVVDKSDNDSMASNIPVSHIASSSQGPKVITVAQAMSAPATSVTHVPDARVVNASMTASNMAPAAVVSLTPIKKSGPTFIFND